MWLHRQYERLFVEEKEFSLRTVLWLFFVIVLTACFLQVDIDELYYKSLAVAPASPPSNDPAEIAQLNRLNKMQEQYFRLVKRPGVGSRADELGERIYNGALDNASFLTEFAWRIMAEKNLRHRDLQLAESAAHRAAELSRGKSIWVTTTYARALFENGKIEEAIEYQTQAWHAAETNQVRGECEATLNKYKRILRERKARESRQGLSPAPGQL